VAAKMKKCNTKDVKRRSREISKFYIGLERFTSFMGEKMLVIFSESENIKDFGH